MPFIFSVWLKIDLDPRLPRPPATEMLPRVLAQRGRLHYLRMDTDFFGFRSQLDLLELLERMRMQRAAAATAALFCLSGVLRGGEPDASWSGKVAKESQER